MIKNFKKELILLFDQLPEFFLEFKQSENLLKIRITSNDKMKVYPLDFVENEFLLQGSSVTPEKIYNQFKESIL